ELEYNRDFIAEILQVEEDRFNQTLTNGLKRFEELLQKSLENENKLIPGEELFKLSDTYGFPLDFAVDLANEKDAGIDFKGYHDALENQKEKSRMSLALKQKTFKTLKDIEKFPPCFTGYQNLEEETELAAIYVDDKPVASLEKGEEGILVFGKTPFYAESGGQVGDTGLGKSDSVLFKVKDTRKTPTDAILHFAQVKTGTLTVGDKVNLTVDGNRRQRIAAHHSTTHLLHAALREVLGLHVKQAGSYVGPDKLRFDFTHYKALTPEETGEVETIVNRKIRENIGIKTDTLNYEEAVEKGAMAIFEEKYSDVVRMLSMGDFSKELCGGTHLEFTGDAGVFKIVHESSISSGIRRIEAVAGETGFEYIRETLDTFFKIQSHFRQKEDRLFDFLVHMEKGVKEKEKELKKQKEADARPSLDQLTAESVTMGGVTVTAAHVESLNRKQLSGLADEIKNKTKGVVVISTNIDNKSAIIVSLDKGLTDRLNAGALVKEIAKVVNGSGGGRPDFAQAGGGPVTDVLNFKKHVSDIINGHLG
ncbi:MAG: alanine--tRNA ligase, partial [bacterium]|nr:alanine--tRNA ligase [bacterium]